VKSRGEIAFAIVVLAILLVVSVLQVRSCSECQGRGGAYVEQHAGWPVCVEKAP
jgi:hypothetical protein